MSSSGISRRQLVMLAVLALAIIALPFATIITTPTPGLSQQVKFAAVGVMELIGATVGTFLNFAIPFLTTAKVLDQNLVVAIFALGAGAIALLN